MSLPGRPKGEYRSAQHEGTPVSLPGRPKGEYRSAKHVGCLMSSSPPRHAPAGGTRVAPGFTLVEVLVALAIVAVSLGAGMKAAAALTATAQRLSEVTAAQWCADNALAGLRLGRQFPGTGEAEFSCHQLGRDYPGRLVTRGTPNPNFRRVDALVLNEQGHVLVSLSTVIGRN